MTPLTQQMLFPLFFELVKLANLTADASSTKSYISCLLKEIEQLCDVLGIITEGTVLDSEIEEMIAARQQARKDRNFALADEIRGKLLDMGIVLEDTREGIKWKACITLKAFLEFYKRQWKWVL